MGQAASSFTVWIAACSAMISAMALIFHGYNFFLSRRALEIEEVFDLWERFERYAAKLDASRNEEVDVQNRCLLDTLNFLENICYIYNNKQARKRILENIKALTTDFIALYNILIPLEKILSAYTLDRDSFCELRKFKEDNDALIAMKERNAQGTVFRQSVGHKIKATQNQHKS